MNDYIINGVIRRLTEWLKDCKINSVVKGIIERWVKCFNV